MPTPPPRVTVVIPTRNRAELLRVCLRSVLTQGYGDLAVLVADNASDDATPHVLAAEHDPRLRVVRRARDIGLLANFQQAAQQVDTPYALFLGDDDVLYPDMLATAIGVLDAHPEVGLFHSAFDLLGPDGEVVVAHASWNGGGADSIEPGRWFVERAMTHSNRVNMSTAVVRTEVGAAAGWFAETDHPLIDLGLWLRIALRAAVAYVDQALVGYRVHPRSCSASMGETGAGRYTFRPEVILEEARVKASVLASPAWTAAERRRLRRSLESHRRQQLLAGIRSQRDDGHDVRKTTRALVEAVRSTPRLAIDGRTWLLLGGTIAPASVVDRLRTGRTDG